MKIETSSRCFINRLPLEWSFECATHESWFSININDFCCSCYCSLTIGGTYNLFTFRIEKTKFENLAFWKSVRYQSSLLDLLPQIRQKRIYVKTYVKTYLKSRWVFKRQRITKFLNPSCKWRLSTKYKKVRVIIIFRLI